MEPRPRAVRLSRTAFPSKWQRSLRTAFFLLRTAPSEDGRTRVAVIVGKAVHPKAAKRNFLKRHIRERIRKSKSFDARDVAITVLRAASGLTKKGLDAELARIAKDAKII